MQYLGDLYDREKASGKSVKFVRGKIRDRAARKLFRLLIEATNQQD